MKPDQLLHQILPILHSVKDNPEKLQKILDFLENEIYEEPQEEEIPEKYRKVVHVIDDKPFSRKLTDALNQKRPFANFKALVESSKYRQQWFDFKQATLERLVWDELSFQLER